MHDGGMIVAIIFALGIANFALNRAVLDSGHELVAQFPGLFGGKGLVSLGFEFAVLLAAMLFAANGSPGVIWAYAIYSGANAVAAWLVLSQRI